MSGRSVKAQARRFPLAASLERAEAKVAAVEALSLSALERAIQAGFVEDGAYGAAGEVLSLIRRVMDEAVE